MQECADRIAYWKKESRFYKQKYLSLKKELEAELRDPYGTIWEYAKKLQDENDGLRKQLNRIKLEVNNCQ